MPELFVCLRVGSLSDVRMQSMVGGVISEPVNIVTKSGERMAGRGRCVERRVGRKRGQSAQYRIELASVCATSGFCNGGDPTKRGQSQN